jgi:hypothetical protein
MKPPFDIFGVDLVLDHERKCDRDHAAGPFRTRIWRAGDLLLPSRGHIVVPIEETLQEILRRSQGTQDADNAA